MLFFIAFLLAVSPQDALTDLALDHFQGEAVCVDLLTDLYGSPDALVRGWTIPNLCDFE